MAAADLVCRDLVGMCTHVFASNVAELVFRLTAADFQCGMAIVDALESLSSSSAVAESSSSGVAESSSSGAADAVTTTTSSTGQTTTTLTGQSPTTLTGQQTTTAANSGSAATTTASKSSSEDTTTTTKSAESCAGLTESGPATVAAEPVKPLATSRFDQNGSNHHGYNSSSCNGSIPLVKLTTDQYGNYVIQGLLDCLDEVPKSRCVGLVMDHMGEVARTKYGRHIIFALKENVSNKSTTTKPRCLCPSTGANKVSPRATNKVSGAGQQSSTTEGHHPVVPHRTGGQKLTRAPMHVTSHHAPHGRAPHQSRATYSMSHGQHVMSPYAMRGPDWGQSWHAWGPDDSYANRTYQKGSVSHHYYAADSAWSQHQ